MKEKLTKNYGLKLISLFCAFFVWLAVVNVANPVMTDTKEVEVTILNPEILESSNLTYEIEGKDTVTVQYTVRTKDRNRFSASDFKAYADLADLYSVTGSVPVRVEAVNHQEYLANNSAVEVKAPGVIHIQTEELQTKRFSLIYKTEGTPEEGYVLGRVRMEPDYVYVRGPVSQVGQISSVGITVGVEGANSDISGTAAPTFFDANENQLTLDNTVTVLEGDISYELTLLKVKSLALDFVVSGSVADGYRYTGVESDVTSVSVAGLKSALANVNTLTIQNPDLSVEGATADRTVEIDLADYLDPGVEIADMEDTTVEVTLKVEPLQDREYTVTEDDIAVTGALEDNNYKLEGTSSITVRGLKEDLDSLSTDKMNLSVDVSQLGEGSHTVRLSYRLDDAYQVVDIPQVQMMVSLKASVSQTQESEAISVGSESVGAVGGENSQPEDETGENSDR